MATALVLIVVFTMSLCFHVLLNRSLWSIFKERRRELSEHPDPERKRMLIRSLKINLGIYFTLGIAFGLGWLQGGLSGGAIAAVGILVIGVLALVAFALKSAWVKSA